MSSMGSQADAVTYYLGSKRRIANVVADATCSLASGGAHAIDLFSGMGSASVAMAEHMDVTAVDVQEYSRVMCAALLEEGAPGSDDKFFDSMHVALGRLESVYGNLMQYEEDALADSEGHARDISDIIENGCLLPAMDRVPGERLRSLIESSRAEAATCSLGDTIVRYFGGTYFSYYQAAQIAAARSALESEEGYARTRLLAAVIAAASHCGSTIGGQFAQPLRTVDSKGNIKASAIAKAVLCRSRNVERSIKDALEEIDATRVPRRGNQAVRSECLSWLSANPARADVIYADPPYSRYHYSRYYHVLETIALGDEPEVTPNPATGRPSRGIYRAGRYQSPFSTRTGAGGAFDSLFERCSLKAPALVLSYSPYPSGRPSTPRMATIDELVRRAGHWFGSVRVVGVDGVKHSKLTSSKDILEASPMAEVMLLCRN